MIDIGVKGTVTFKGKQNRYILTVEDVFSRFVWLSRLKGKPGLLVHKELKNLYHQHGLPLVLECDQGTEVKGAVKGYKKISVSRSFAAAHTILNHKVR